MISVSFPILKLVLSMTLYRNSHFSVPLSTVICRHVVTSSLQTLELDRRLQRLEALIGSREASVTGPGGLVDTAARLSERVALLQPSYLEQVEARIATLQTKLTSITKNPESSLIVDADTQNKVRNLLLDSTYINIALKCRLIRFYNFLRSVSFLRL